MKEKDLTQLINNLLNNNYIIYPFCTLFNSSFFHLFICFR